MSTGSSGDAGTHPSAAESRQQVSISHRAPLPTRPFYVKVQGSYEHRGTVGPSTSAFAARALLCEPDAGTRPATWRVLILGAPVSGGGCHWRARPALGLSMMTMTAAARLTPTLGRVGRRIESETSYLQYSAVCMSLPLLFPRNTMYKQILIFDSGANSPCGEMRCWASLAILRWKPIASLGFRARKLLWPVWRAY